MVIFLPNDTIHAQSFFYKPGGQVIIAILVISIAAIMLLLITLSEQRKSREKRNRKISAEMKDLYENAPCGYHSLNSDGTITRINNTELNWLGYSREEVIGHSYKKFLTPASQVIFDEFLSTLLNNQNIEGTVLEIQTKSGKTFFASTSAVVLLNEGNFALARASTFDISDRIKLEKRLEFLANTDVLTGISNRRHFFEQVEPLFTSKVQQPMSLLMIDIDYFKKINDNYGHDAGDEVLKQIAKIIKKQQHHTDIFARFGGEEFVIFTKQPIGQAAELAERINQCVAGSPIKVTSTLTLPATLSIGVASCKAPECDIDDILKQADIALYKAKENGRDRVEVVR
ncbi:sensor domain-containing diguanylate cyclase [Vibrio gangliei]|uniref:sensor domain-containing diguanylate cyclase n=1 Tax=Vibrio gangliei TaxID=2077090 RepID=UPI000D01F598|nr:sensor domain-containing diguanylate cyclase [Vibrio gangliei]